MPVITRAAFSKIAGVNRVQVTKLIKSGTLTGRKDAYIDTASPKNAAYLKKHGAAIKKRDGIPWPLRKLMADAMLKEKQREILTVRQGRELGMLVEREALNQMMAAFGVELKLRFLDLPRRIAPHIHSVVKAGGGPRAVEEILDKELADGLRHAKEKARAAGLGSIAT